MAFDIGEKAQDNDTLQTMLDAGDALIDDLKDDRTELQALESTYPIDTPANLQANGETWFFKLRDSLILSHNSDLKEIRGMIVLIKREQAEDL